MNADITWQELEDLEQGHQAMLQESGILPAVAQLRGYTSAYSRAVLRHHGFHDGPIGGLLLPVWQVNGTLAYHQYRPDSPQLGRDGKARRYLNPPRTHKVIDAHPLIREHLADSTVDLWITEGIKKADSAVSHGLCCIGLTDVWAFGSKGAYGNFEPFEDWEAIALDGRIVYVAYDSDVMRKREVHKALRKLRRFLMERGATVNIIYFPDKDDGEKQGLDDYFASGKAVGDLYGLSSNELRSDRERLILSANLAEKVAAAWSAVAERNDPVRLVMHGGHPTRITQTETGASLTLINQDVMMLEVSRAIDTVSVRQGRGENAQAVETSIMPPKPLVAGMLAAERPPLPELERMVKVPVFAPDGSLQTSSGYSAKTKTYYAHAQGFALPPIPERPTKHQLEDAKALIGYMLTDFPFVGEADRAHAHALGLLPYVRNLIDEPTPGHMFEAPEAGNGKDLLVRMLLWPALGGEPEGITEQATNEGWGKALTAALIKAPDAILISNLNEPVRSGNLAKALTQKTWDDRILGGSTTVNVTIRSIWALTGNNPEVDKELTRRMVRTRLNAHVEQPWLRPIKDFTIPNLEQWVAEHRAQLAAAYLTLVAHWFAQGQPKGTQSLGSYGRWSEVMGGILEAAGIPGFLGNLKDFYSMTDTESEMWQTLTELWWMHFLDKPVKTEALNNLAYQADLIDAKTTAQQFGVRLRKQLDRKYGPYTIGKEVTRGYSRWYLKRDTDETEFEVKQREQALKLWQKEQANRATLFGNKTG